MPVTWGYRLYPPVIGLPRVIQHDVTLSGYTVPKGVSGHRIKVSVTLGSVHHSSTGVPGRNLFLKKNKTKLKSTPYFWAQDPILTLESEIRGTLKKIAPP